DVTDRVGGEGGGDANVGNQDSGDGRPNEAGEVENDRVDRQGRGQGRAIDQGRYEGEARGLRDGAGDPEQQHEFEQEVDRDQIGLDEDGEERRLGAAAQLGDPDDPHPVAPVGQNAGEGAQEQYRQ